MAIQHKVVELKGQSDPRASGETPEVTAEAIETALNQQGRDNWELFTILERFTETSHTEASHYAGIGSSSQRYSARIAVTSSSRRSWRNLLGFLKMPPPIGCSGQLPSGVEGNSAPDFPLIHDGKPPRLFFHQHFKPVGTCACDSKVPLFFPGHFVPASFCNDVRAIVRIDFL